VRRRRGRPAKRLKVTGTQPAQKAGTPLEHGTDGSAELTVQKVWKLLSVADRVRDTGSNATGKKPHAPKTKTSERIGGLDVIDAIQSAPMVSRKGETCVKQNVLKALMTVEEFAFQKVQTVEQFSNHRLSISFMLANLLAKSIL